MYTAAMIRLYSVAGCIASRNINISESGQSLAIPPTETFDHLRSCNCNDSQTKAIVAAASQVLTLIHGPPGTGKVVYWPCIMSSANPLVHLNVGSKADCDCRQAAHAQVVKPVVIQHRIGVSPFELLT